MITKRTNQKLEDTFKKIKHSTHTISLTSAEEESLLENLEAVSTRLKKRDYKRYSYQNNKFNVPQRARDFFIELEFYSYLGKTWQQILEQLDINQFKTIVDICPGYFPKIELGLFYLDFKGEVLLLDQDKKSLDQAEKFISMFSPKFKIIKEKANLFMKMKTSYQLVLANHVLDDLVLYYFSNKQGVKLINIYQNEKQIISVWKYILQNKEKSMREILPILTENLSKLVDKNGYLCIVHYPSYMEKMLNLKDVSQFNKHLLKKLSQELEKNGFLKEHEKITRAFKNFKGHFNKSDCILVRRVF